jgi:glycerol-1-phosphate dehydrogenase [NAD(P)+]
VLADLDVIAGAPAGMNASGYADLLAKCAAGGDWILADAAGVEPIDAPGWNAVQGLLRSWLASPGGVVRNDPVCLRNLIHGLMMSGFAMQALRSSRPASGAEHQFSHLWDMQQHAHNGAAPSHGFKVGIGTLASLALYEDLLCRDTASFDIQRAVENWPPCETLEERIVASLGAGDLASKAQRETRAKHPSREVLREQLVRLRDAWPRLQARLRRHLLPFAEARDMLREAGCAFAPEQIGISRERLRLSYRQACFIRRRFTVLDFAERWGLTRSALDNIFGSGGPWPLAAPEETDRRP